MPIFAHYQRFMFAIIPWLWNTITSMGGSRGLWGYYLCVSRQKTLHLCCEQEETTLSYFMWQLVINNVVRIFATFVDMSHNMADWKYKLYALNKSLRTKVYETKYYFEFFSLDNHYHFYHNSNEMIFLFCISKKLFLNFIFLPCTL